MVIEDITLRHFRNYEEETFSLTQGVNIICGENAQGKTNLLEAAHFLSAARSFRALKKNELVRFGQDAATVLAKAVSRNRNFDIRLDIGGNPARAAFCVNGIRLRRNFEISDILRCVLFSPDDLMLIKGGPALRRDFLDGAVLKLRPKYAAALGEYGRLLQHKTKILKDSEKKPSLLSLLDDFSIRLCEAGAHIVSRRTAMTKALLREIVPVYRQMSGAREDIALSYQTAGTIPPGLEDITEIKECLLRHYRAHRAAEIAGRSCLSGPHKDELAILINGKPARLFGSQGQIRTVTLGLKLAECQLLYRDMAEYPILLLDDILSELDASRQDFVLNRIGQGQVLITCCEADRHLKSLSGRWFSIEAGKILSVTDL